MHRLALLCCLVLPLACARQPTCPPWASTGPGTSSAAQAPVDGTRVVTVPPDDDTLLTVVGAGAAADGVAPAAASAEAPPEEARAFFAGRCVPCHGEHGRGDGPTGLALDPHPRNFTDKTWQRSVTDAHIEKVILEGGPSVGKSPLMPPHGDLAGNPALLSGMRLLIREFGR